MTSILIGNPLELTKKGVLELHKLKYKETYIYRQRTEYEKIDHHYIDFNMSPKITFLEVEEVIEEIYLSSESSADFYILPFKVSKKVFMGEEGLEEFYEEVDKTMYQDGLNTPSYVYLSFYFDMMFPNEEMRIDKDLLYLFNNDRYKENFEYSQNPRLLIIPDDVDWFIGENEMGYEYIEEKSRSWS